ncbi:MAG: hypothetical protein ABIR47_06875, partial [Candidatus Kapaibacterium sp.]
GYGGDGNEQGNGDITPGHAQSGLELRCNAHREILMTKVVPGVGQRYTGQYFRHKKKLARWGHDRLSLQPISPV